MESHMENAMETWGRMYYIPTFGSLALSSLTATQVDVVLKQYPPGGFALLGLRV